MKKIFIWGIVTVLSFNNFNTFALEKQKDLSVLADKMTQEIDFSQFKDKKSAEKYIWEYDALILEEIQTLSLDEKYKLFDIIREKNGLWNDVLLDNIVEVYKERWEFIWDSGEDFDKVFERVNQNTQKSSCNAPLKTFPYHIYYNTPSGGYINAYYVSSVKNSQDEGICDIEVWFDTPRKSKIWSTNYLWRLMLSSSVGFWWILSTRDVSYNRMSVIIWGQRALLFTQWQGDLFNNLVVW